MRQDLGDTGRAVSGDIRAQADKVAGKDGRLVMQCVIMNQEVRKNIQEYWKIPAVDVGTSHRVIKTAFPGMAMGVAATLDALNGQKCRM